VCRRILLAILLLLIAIQAHAQTFVKATGASSTSCGNWTYSFTPTNANDLWVVCAAGGGTGSTNPLPNTVTDNNGGTWTVGYTEASTVNKAASMCSFSLGHPGGATTVTINSATGNGGCGQTAVTYEFTGVSTATLDIHPTANSTSASPAIGPTATLSQPDEIAISEFGINNPAAATLSSGPTGGFIDSGQGLLKSSNTDVGGLSGYQITAATTALSTGYTISASDPYSAGLITLATTPTCTTPICYVQQVTNNCTGTSGATTIPITVMAAGDFLALSCNSSWSTSLSTANISSVTDNRRNAWVKAINLDKSGVTGYAADAEVWYEQAAYAGATTVTVNQTGATPPNYTLDCSITEYNGMNLATVDKTATNFTAVNSSTPGTIGPTAATTAANELGIVAYGSNGETYNVLSALGGTTGTWNRLTTGGCSAVGYDILGTSGTVGTSLSFTGTDNFAGALAAFTPGPPPGTLALVGFEAGLKPSESNVAFLNGTIWGINQGAVGTNHGIQSTVVHSGGYAYWQRWALNEGITWYVYPNATSGQGQVNNYASTYFYSTVAGSTSNNANEPILQLKTAGGTAISSVLLSLTSAGGSNVRLYNNVAAHQVGSDAALSTGAWHLVELYTTVGAAGSTVEGKLDNVVFATSAVENTGTTGAGSLSGWTQGNSSPVSATGDVYWDDIVWSNAAYDGAHTIVARSSSGQTSTPTYNTFTLTGAARIDQIWSLLPWNVADYAVPPGNNIQTEFLEPFNLASGQVARGSQVIASADTIKGAEVHGIYIGQNGSVGGAKTRWILNGTVHDDVTANGPFWGNGSSYEFGGDIFIPSWNDLNGQGGSTPPQVGVNVTNKQDNTRWSEVWLEVDVRAAPTQTPTPTATATGTPTPTPTATATATPTPVPTPCVSAICLGQCAYGQNAGNSPTTVGPLTVSAAGNLLVMGCYNSFWNAPPVALTGVTDNQANNWHLAFKNDQTNNPYIIADPEIWFEPNAPASPTTITVNQTGCTSGGGGNCYMACSVCEYHGFGPNVSAWDAHAVGQSPGTATMSVGPTALIAAPLELGFALYAVTDGTYLPSSTLNPAIGSNGTWSIIQNSQLQTSYNVLTSGKFGTTLTYPISIGYAGVIAGFADPTPTPIPTNTRTPTPTATATGTPTPIGTPTPQADIFMPYVVPR